MARQPLDSTYFVQQVKTQGSIPSGRYSDPEILLLASDAIRDELVPFIMELREEYYLTHEDQTITQGVSAYPIPKKSMGLTVREVKRILGERVIDIDRISPTQARTTASGTPRVFYVKSQDIILYPTPDATGDTLRAFYNKQPSDIVETSECALITAIDTVTGIVTATPPTTWTVSSEMDFISQDNGHIQLASEITPSAISTTTVTFATADLPTTLRIGDYIALTGQTPYVEAPDVCFSLAVRLTINLLLDSMGDQTGLASSQDKTNKLRASVAMLMGNRTPGAPKRSIIRTL